MKKFLRPYAKEIIFGSLLIPFLFLYTKYLTKDSFLNNGYLFLLIPVGFSILFVLGLFIYITISDFYESNTVYQCPNEKCNLYFRKYQIDLFKAAHGKMACPHCIEELNFLHAKDVERYINESAEAPKINRLAFYDIQKSVKKLENFRLQREADERFSQFQESRRVHPEKQYQWIQNIQPVKHLRQEQEDVKGNK